MKDVMIDIETLGTKPGYAVISVGAYAFDPLGEQLLNAEPNRPGYFDPADPGFHQNVCWKSVLDDFGMKVDGNTLDWWVLPNGSEPSAEAFDAITHDQQVLPKVLHRLNAFLTRQHANNVWADDPSFDCNLLEVAYEICKIEKIWSFRRERSVRTMRWLAAEMKLSLPEPIGIPHNPLHDAYNQAREVICVVQHLGLK
jgi:hypothetical protein